MLVNKKDNYRFGLFVVVVSFIRACSVRGMRPV